MGSLARARVRLNASARRFNNLSKRWGPLVSFLVAIGAFILSTIAVIESKTVEDNVSVLTNSQSQIGMVVAGQQPNRGQLFGDLDNTLVFMNAGSRNAAILNAWVVLAQLKAHTGPPVYNCAEGDEHAFFVQDIPYDNFEPFVLKANDVLIRRLTFKDSKPYQGEGDAKGQYLIGDPRIHLEEPVFSSVAEMVECVAIEIAIPGESRKKAVVPMRYFRTSGGRTIGGPKANGAGFELPSQKIPYEIFKQQKLELFEAAAPDSH